jgi:ribosomal protein S18 acetylase RimI-like enzyme
MNGTIDIREMELGDLPAVYALGERVFTPDASPSLYRTWDQYELVVSFASDGETCLVAELDDQIVGFATGTMIHKARSAWTYGYLLWLAVEPALARQGIARRLLKRMTDLFVDAGARMLLVDTDAENESALAFFRREGFGNDQAHVYLSKNLSRPRRRRGAAANKKPRRQSARKIEITRGRDPES